MKHLVLKSIYTGLGLLGSGKETVEQLGRKLAKQADISEKDGERIARHLQQRSEKAVNSLRKTLDVEVNKVVASLKEAAKDLSRSGEKKSTPHRRRAKRKPPAKTEE
jgi:hypothetical protein